MDYDYVSIHVVYFKPISWCVSFFVLQDECKRLRQSIKCGFIAPMTVVIMHTKFSLTLNSIHAFGLFLWHILCLLVGCHSRQGHGSPGCKSKWCKCCSWELIVNVMVMSLVCLILVLGFGLWVKTMYIKLAAWKKEFLVVGIIQLNYISYLGHWLL